MTNKPNTLSRKTFNFEFKADDGETYTGQFTTKRLAIKDRAKVGVKKSQLMGGMHCVRDEEGVPTGQGVDEYTDSLNEMIAHLEVSLEQKPVWFNLEEIADVELVQAVYREVMDFEMSFFRAANRADDTRGSDEVGEGDRSAQPQGTGARNHPTPVVDEKVQATLDA